MGKCPKCNQNSFIKTPGIRIMRESFGSSIHIANSYTFICYNKECNHSGKVKVNTKMGDYFEKPWYKRIFSWLS